MAFHVSRAGPWAPYRASLTGACHVFLAQPLALARAARTVAFPLLKARPLALDSARQTARMSSPCHKWLKGLVEESQGLVERSVTSASRVAVLGWQDMRRVHTRLTARKRAAP